MVSVWEGRLAEVSPQPVIVQIPPRISTQTNSHNGMSITVRLPSWCSGAWIGWLLGCRDKLHAWNYLMRMWLTPRYDRSWNGCGDVVTLVQILWFRRAFNKNAVKLRRLTRFTSKDFECLAFWKVCCIDLTGFISRHSIVCDIVPWNFEKSLVNLPVLLIGQALWNNVAVVTVI